MLNNSFHHTAKRIFQILQNAESVLLIPHQKPDGDALGSCTAFSEWLTEQEKSVSIFCATDYGKNFLYLPHVSTISSNTDIWEQKKFDTIIVFDSGDLRYAGVNSYIQNLSYKPTLINIDHHATNEYYGDVNLVDTHFSSTCEVVFEFFETNSVRLNKNMATSLLTGLITDTDHFTNSATSSTALHAAGFLMKKSGKHRHIKETLYNTLGISALQLWGKVLERLEKNQELDIIFTSLNQKDILEFGLSESESEGMANFLNTLSEGKAALILKEVEHNVWKGSFRTTKNDVDVAKIAKTLGGGGHKKAAGFTLQGDKTTVLEKIFQTIREIKL